ESEDAGDRALVAGEPLAGRVAGPDGAPLADAEVTLAGALDDDAERLPVTVTTAADGSFRFAASSRGATLSVRKLGLAVLDVPNVKPGLLPRPLVASAGASLAGTVKRPDGKPAPAALVRFEGGATSRWVE